MKTKICPTCSKEFKVIIKGANYCSGDCEIKAAKRIK